MLKNTVGLVTGGASGLGRATVERFAREGAKVTLCDLPSSEGENLAKHLGPNVLFAPMDVTSEADVTAALEATKKKFNRLDAVINCAGIAVAHKTYNFNKNTAHHLEEFAKVLVTCTRLLERQLSCHVISYFRSSPSTPWAPST